ncbi:hypothetical protein MKW92_021863 [Papaver armeniacum]|nr:hypothetical protein MKW92_021863 [Papaver armeniacum]
MVEEEGGSIPEKQIWVGGGSKPVDGGEAEKKDQIHGVRNEAAIRRIVHSFKPKVVAIEQATVINRHHMNSALCKCRVTSCVPYSGSGSDQVFKATIEGCALHQVDPKVMFRQPGSWCRRFREKVARRSKMRLEMERQRKEESIRSKKIRCCSTSLLGETS